MFMLNEGRQTIAMRRASALGRKQPVGLLNRERQESNRKQTVSRTIKPHPVRFFCGPETLVESGQREVPQ
jgi:hypothetical protein